MSEQVWWYATRAAGLMTWATATASIVFGLLLSTRAVRSRTGPWFLDFHRFLGGISVVFLAAHLVTLWADSYVDFGVREIFVPGESAWKTEAIAWGIIGAYLLVAIEVSSLLRARISGALWRVIHFSSFAAMIAGTYHAITAGSDVDNPITWVIAGIGTVLVLGLISMRLQRQDPDEPGLTRLSDNREILEEMRQRLADLPVPESTPQPQISVTPNASLPRRAPVSSSLPEVAAPAPPAPGAVSGFSADPFAAVPLPSADPQLGSWVEPSPADPFAANSRDPRPLPSRGSAPDDRDTDLFAAAPADEPADPFELLGVAPAEPTESTPAEAPGSLESPPDLFSTAVGDEIAIEFVGNPFGAPLPTPSVIQAPPTPSPDQGPPPLPNAVDPVTGEPDEAAYTAWLKDWLAFAERYGDEAPGDPTRV